MQTKFNIGDRVKILDGSDIDGYIGGWTPHMNRLVGRIATIDQIRITDKGIGYYVEENLHVFDERGLAFISSKSSEPVEPTKDDLDEDDSLLFLAAVLAGLL